MEQKDVISKIEQERKNLKQFYWWQVFWGIVFLVILFISSFVLGARSNHFWLYVIIPLIVLGSFWIYIQSTRKSVDLKLNQRVMEFLTEDFLSGWKFFPVYKLDESVFEESCFVEKFSQLDMQNALVGKINDLQVVFLNLTAFSTNPQEDKRLYAFSGVFAVMDKERFNLPEFGVYPKNKNLSKLMEKCDLEPVPSNLNNEFQVLARRGSKSTGIEVVGPVILKYAHICGISEKFYFSTFGNKISFGVNDMRDLLNFDIKQPIDREVFEEQVKCLKAYIEFLREIYDKFEII